MITKEDLLKNRDQIFPDEYTTEISNNLDYLLDALSILEQKYCEDTNDTFVVNSGWRPRKINANTKGAATESTHLIGLAADIKDNKGMLLCWLRKNIALLESLELYCEDPRWTKTWIHFQRKPPKSGKRIYIPNSSEPTDPTRLITS